VPSCYLSLSRLLPAYRPPPHRAAFDRNIASRTIASRPRGRVGLQEVSLLTRYTAVRPQPGRIARFVARTGNISARSGRTPVLRFCGVFYHLRHPSLALEKIAPLAQRPMIETAPISPHAIIIQVCLGRTRLVAAYKRHPSCGLPSQLCSFGTKKRPGHGARLVKPSQSAQPQNLRRPA
jgi:hypothetical protein